MTKDELSNYFAELGKKGGNACVKKHGLNYMSKIGKRAAKVKKTKKLSTKKVDKRTAR